MVQAACTDDVAARMRRQLEKDLASGGVGDGDAGGWLRDVEAGVLRALAARGGGATGAQLSADEPRLRTQLVYAAGKAYGGAANITSRVLVLIAAEGRIDPGAPAGRVVVRAVRVVPARGVAAPTRRCAGSRWRRRVGQCR